MRKTQLSFQRSAVRMRDVLGDVLRLVDAFNKNDWDAYQQYLDQNVVAYNLGARLHNRQRNVTNYFRGISDPKDKLALQFGPTNDITWFPGVFPLFSAGGRSMDS